MRRLSIYVSAAAADQLNLAVDQVMLALEGIPKHVALSALVSAAAHNADAVITRIAAERAQTLTAQLGQLRSPAPPERDGTPGSPST